METIIRIGVIDDEHFVLEGMKTWMQQLDDIRIAGMARSVHHYLEGSPQPGIVVMDLQLRDGSDPASNVRRLVEVGNEVIVLSVALDQEYAYSTLEAGAATYIVKDSNLDALATAIREVASGQDILTASHAFLLSRDKRPTRPDLSKREIEVLTALAKGTTIKAVANRLGISQGTVTTYIERIRAKYETAGRPIRSRGDFVTRLREDRPTTENKFECACRELKSCYVNLL